MLGPSLEQIGEVAVALILSPLVSLLGYYVLILYLEIT